MHQTSGLASRTRGALRLLGAATCRPLTGPRLVGIEITHFCNLNCGFCESHGRFMPAPVVKTRTYVGERRTMDLETIERLAKSLGKLGVEWVELSGKGDPIVHPKLPEIVRLIKDAGLRCSMFTNGAVPRPGLAATLVEAGLDRLNLSLNAATRETYARVTSKDVWEKALAFLNEVIERKRQSGRGKPWVRVTHVICKDNVDDMDASVTMACDLGVDEGGWCIMGELQQTRAIQLDRREADGLLARMPEWIARLDAAGVAHDLATFEEDLRLRLGTGVAEDNPLQRGLPCYEGWMHTVIAPDGAVAPCCYCENEQLGNVVEQDFAEIWRGERYQDFRRRSLDMPKTQKAICRECFTTCNKAQENRRTHLRLRSVGLGPRTEPAPAEAVAAGETAVAAPAAGIHAFGVAPPGAPAAG